MNHNHEPSQLNVLVCKICKRDMMAHLPSAQCESCGKPDLNDKGKSALEIVNDMLLCRSCFSNHLEASSEIVKDEKIPEPIAKIEAERFNTLPNAIDKVNSNYTLVDLPLNGNEYFNKAVLAHVELEKKIFADANIPSGEKHFFFAKQIMARRNILQKALVDIRDLWLESKNELAAAQQTLNLLSAKLRKEQREELKLKDVSYIPATPPKKVGTPRMKAADKVIEGIAKTLFAPRVNGIIQWEALEAAERQNYINMAKNVYHGTVKEVKELNTPKTEVKETGNSDIEFTEE
jgi:hypothetical protein